MCGQQILINVLANRETMVGIWFPVQRGLTTRSDQVEHRVLDFMNSMRPQSNRCRWVGGKGRGSIAGHRLLYALAAAAGNV